LLPTSWSAAQAEIDRIIATTTDDPFKPTTVANVRQFVSFARDHCPVPEIGKGYWSTIRFTWDVTPPLEIEVFGDSFEIYRFYDQRTDISEVKCSAGEALPLELTDNLPRIGETGAQPS